MSIPALTTEAKVRVRMSTVGVDKRVDHVPAGALADVIGRASSEAAGYLYRYPLEAVGSVPGLADSGWVSDMVADVAVYHLCRYRLNPIPVSAKDIYEQVIEMFKLVQAGKMQIPGLDNSASVPAIVNYDVQYDQNPRKQGVSLLQ
jgi:phage gp36-like protein